MTSSADGRLLPDREDTRHGAVAPVLPADWFLSAGRTISWRGQAEALPAQSFACAFLGDILLVYHNPAMRDTFGQNGVTPQRYVVDGGTTAEGRAVRGPLAHAIRA